MNEPNWFEWAAGIAMAALGWLFKRHVNRVDELEKNAVTHTQLGDALKQMREDRLRMHEENREDLAYIRERLDSIVDRGAHR